MKNLTHDKALSLCYNLPRVIIMMDKIKLLETKENQTVDSYRIKLDKIFSKSASDLSLISALNTYTKSELDDIRHALEVKGVSSLKKADLIDVLAIEIASQLSQIVKKLSKEEYGLLKFILDSDGIVSFDHNFAEALISIRKYGIVMASQLENHGKVLFIPDELRKALRLLIPSSIPHERGKRLKIGRNAPCPCGSGRKYKKCCLSTYLQNVV